MTTWVLLRGLARESRHWGRFAEDLHKAVPWGDRVVMLDLPGNGTRWRDATPWRIEAIARAARDELATRQVPAPFVLVAMSLGGMVALHWAARDPGAIHACVLINSSLRGMSPFWRRLRPRALLELLAVAAPGASVLAREQRILRLTSNLLPADAAVAASWAEHARTAPVSRSNMLRQLVAAARFRAPASPPPVPMLLLASTGDRLVSVRCSRALARAWRLPLREHPAAGHDLPLDDPAWVIEEALAWTRQLAHDP